VLTHVAGAIVVTLLLLVVCFLVLQKYPDQKYLKGPALTAGGLLGLQLSLGVAAYITRQWSPNDPQPLNPMVAITVTHVACGALVFATTIVLTLRVFRVWPATIGVSEFSLDTQRVMG
jgi:heme A synthase